MTRAASASDSTSSAIINIGRPPATTLVQQAATIQTRLLIFFSCSSISTHFPAPLPAIVGFVMK